MVIIVFYSHFDVFLKFPLSTIISTMKELFHSFIHSFTTCSHKKAINIYMLTCSEAVPQRYSHEQALWKIRGKIIGGNPCRSMTSKELPHSSTKIPLTYGWIRRSSQNTPHKIPSEGIITSHLRDMMSCLRNKK